MRKSLVIAGSVILSLAVTACGNTHKGKAKAKLAAAKATGDKGTVKKAQKEVKADIKSQIEELNKMNFHGMDENYSVAGFTAAFKSNTPEERKKIKSILNDIKGQAEELVKSAKDLKDENKVKQAESLKTRAVNSITKVENAEKAEQIRAEMADTIPFGN